MQYCSIVIVAGFGPRLSATLEFDSKLSFLFTNEGRVEL